MKSTFERELSFIDEGLGRLLVRVRAVAKGDALHRSSKLVLGQFSGSILLSEVTADSLVVPSSLLESLKGQVASLLLINVALALLPGLKELGVVLGIREDGNTSVIFGGCTEQSNTSDIDFFDCVGESAGGLGDRFGEGIQVANHDGDGRDRLSLKISLIGRDVAGEDT